MRLPQEIIRAKRDGGTLSDDEIAAFIRGLTDGAVTEGQAAAFAMAVFFRGLSVPEAGRPHAGHDPVRRCARLGPAGPRPRQALDGGVGDTVSLPLAPMVAACGGYVPMISGRGLGHTGGTLDKLASLPGYDVAPDPDLFRRVVAEVGCAIIGQTARMAPADKRLYAIRDVTGTVESLDLITASILSKKLAAGLGGLVMDVKQGSGAFMEGLRRPAPSARASCPWRSAPACRRRPHHRHGRAARLGRRQRRRGRLRRRLSHRPAAGAALPRNHPGARRRDAGAGRPRRDPRGGASRLEDALASGRAAERFARMVAALGGPSDLLDRPEAHLPAAPVRRRVEARARWRRWRRGRSGSR